MGARYKKRPRSRHPCGVLVRSLAGERLRKIRAFERLRRDEEATCRIGGGSGSSIVVATLANIESKLPPRMRRTGVGVGVGWLEVSLHASVPSVRLAPSGGQRKPILNEAAYMVYSVGERSYVIKGWWHYIYGRSLGIALEQCVNSLTTNANIIYSITIHIDYGRPALLLFCILALYSFA